jgi:anti-sigma factor RsiW
MDAAPSAHPPRQNLDSFGLGKLDDRSAQVVSDHLKRCPDCRKQVAELSADSFLGRVRDAHVPAMSTHGQSQTTGDTFVQPSVSAAASPSRSCRIAAESALLRLPQIDVN